MPQMALPGSTNFLACCQNFLALCKLKKVFLLGGQDTYATKSIAKPTKEKSVTVTVIIYLEKPASATLRAQVRKSLVGN
jgi:hypothetical protein